MEPAAAKQSRTPLILALICILAFAVRLPSLFQSLWYDEMYTLIHYISASWRDVFAGKYSPNNHVLFTILAKLITPNEADPAVLIRLPSIAAGSLIPLALAWPLRSRPFAAIVVALVMALHPWLVGFSGYARGYALLLLLAILATNALPSQKQLLDWRYALLVTATLYTHPLAAPVFVGHTLAILVLRRDLLLTFIRSAALAGVMTVALYLPLVTGAQDYWKAPEKPSVTYREFVDHSIRYAHAGYEHPGLAHLVFPMFVLTVGGYLAWRRDLLRPHLLSLATASLLGIVIPLFLPLSGEVRAMLWLIPLYALGVTAFLLPSTFAQTAGAGHKAMERSDRLPVLLQRIALPFVILTLGYYVYFIATIPAQPIREGLVLARRTAPPTSRVIGLHMGAIEAFGIYGGPGRGLHACAYELDQLREAEAATPGGLVVVVFYERFLERDKPELWRYLRKNYAVSHRLPGRVSPTAIYVHKTLP